MNVLAKQNQNNFLHFTTAAAGPKSFFYLQLNKMDQDFLDIQLVMSYQSSYSALAFYPFS